MDNPLVGRKLIWTYETGAEGATFEVEFISNKQLTSKGRGTAEGFFATMDYDLGVVAPDIYFLTYNKGVGEVISIVINLNTRQVYASYSSSSPERIFMTGTVKEVLE